MQGLATVVDPVRAFSPTTSTMTTNAPMYLFVEHILLNLTLSDDLVHTRRIYPL